MLGGGLIVVNSFGVHHHKRLIRKPRGGPALGTLLAIDARDARGSLSDSRSETHQDYSPADATRYHSLPLDPYAMMAITCGNGR